MAGNVCVCVCVCLGGNPLLRFPTTRREEAPGLQIPSDSALKGAAPALGNRRRVRGAAVGKDGAPRSLPSAAAAPLPPPPSSPCCDSRPSRSPLAAAGPPPSLPQGEVPAGAARKPAREERRRRRELPSGGHRPQHGMHTGDVETM
ncbi:hypothetical protein GRJ2_000364700 [Grus japonensis]|uniref:Uncharacterized protein n=1 Tax=Grus japonensis TaxID=30415 RepID=A0ABC9W038_GRUJA